MLRKATGASDLKAIERDGDRYRVDPTVFAVDLWRFQHALAAARHAQLDPAVAAALAQAGEAYGGVLLDGAPYAWVEVPREECGGGRWMRWPGWPSCATGSATRRGRLPRWSRRWPPTRWPRSCTGG